MACLCCFFSTVLTDKMMILALVQASASAPFKMMKIEVLLWSSLVGQINKIKTEDEDEARAFMSLLSNIRKN